MLALHGRLGGWWTQFGLAVSSVVCFLAVLMAWYGVNFVLGKGLHSYGFGIGGGAEVAKLNFFRPFFVLFCVWGFSTSKIGGAPRGEKQGESRTAEGRVCSRRPRGAQRRRRR